LSRNLFSRRSIVPRLHTVSRAIVRIVSGSLAVSAASALLAAGAPQAPTVPSQTPPASQQQPSAIELKIGGGDPTTPPRFAVPDFVALSQDAETREAARTLASVLRNDLDFEREFLLASPEVLKEVPAAASVNDVPFDRWRELNVDGVVFGTVQKTAKGIHVEVRLLDVRSRQSVFGQGYEGPQRDQRWIAHTASDEIHLQQRNLVGVARTKLAFNSDRSGDHVRNTVERRTVRDIYIADYDGENQTRIISNGSLNVAPAWSPDSRSIGYTSWRTGMMQLFLSNVYEGTSQQLTNPPGENSLPAWSPDGKRVAFTSTRDGNSEIYVMDRSGSPVHRLTTNSAIDTSPTWSPTGTLIAFISDRTGMPELFVMDADGLGVKQLTHEDAPVDRPTWSPAPFNEIAYSKRNSSGFDIKVYDLATGNSRSVTSGEGSNESPAFSPSGRHLAFTSTRAGGEQIFVVGRDGAGLRQVTKTGNNRQASWSRGPR
jgi:TolB protein